MFDLSIDETPKRKLLNLLLEESRSLSELSEEMDMSKSAVLKHLDSLEEAGVVRSFKEKTSIGRRKVYDIKSFSTCISISEEGYAISFQAGSSLDPDFPLVNQIPQKELREEVKEYLRGLKITDKEFSVVIFGSVARGEATWKSDIDAVLFSDSWDGEKEQVLEKMSEVSMREDVERSMNPHFHSYDDLENPARLIKEVKEEGMIVHSKGDDRLWKDLERYSSI